MGGPQAWGLGEVLTTPRHKNVSCYEIFTQKASDPCSCECGDEPSVSIKCEEFCDWLRTG
jgi:hypothetical protein